MNWGNYADACRWTPELKSKAVEAYEQAIRLAERDLGVNPRDAEVRATLALYCMGLSFAKRALQEIDDALAEAPGNVNVLFRAGLVHEMAGRRAAAIKNLEAAIQAGYSFAEINRHPDLAALRLDPAFVPLADFARKNDNSKNTHP